MINYSYPKGRCPSCQELSIHSSAQRHREDLALGDKFDSQKSFERRKKVKRSTLSGFTVIEFVLWLAVAAGLAAIALPAIQ